MRCLRGRRGLRAITRCGGALPIVFRTQAGMRKGLIGPIDSLKRFVGVRLVAVAGKLIGMICLRKKAVALLYLLRSCVRGNA